MPAIIIYAPYQIFQSWDDPQCENIGRWLFNVSGRDAVELKMKSGRTYRIGTDRPDALEAAVRAAREEKLENA